MISIIRFESRVLRIVEKVKRLLSHKNCIVRMQSSPRKKHAFLHRLIQFYSPVFISVCSSFGVRWTAIPPCNWPRWSGFCFHSVYLWWHLFYLSFVQTIVKKKTRAEEDLFLGIEHAAKFRSNVDIRFLSRIKTEGRILEISKEKLIIKKRWRMRKREREKTK